MTNATVYEAHGSWWVIFDGSAIASRFGSESEVTDFVKKMQQAGIRIERPREH